MPGSSSKNLFIFTFKWDSPSGVLWLMNIIVKTSSGRITVRPDTTWEKDNEDFYPPEFVDELTYAPVLFARILKPGRSVGKKFASRYYDSVGFGVLLYPENIMDGSPESYAQSICLDHTSFLPSPFFPASRIGLEGSLFRLECEREELFSYDGSSLDMIEDAIAESTKMVYIRTGDLVAIELADRKPLARRPDGSVRVSGVFGADKVMDFRIVF